MIYRIFGLISNSVTLFFLVTIFVNQYYSIKRFIKINMIILTKKVNKSIFFLYLISVIFSLKSSIILIFLPLIYSLLFIYINRPIKIRITRKNLTLFLFSLIVSFFLPSVYYFNSLFSIILAFIIQYPIEFIIKKYYLKKARKKINPHTICIGITGSYGKTSFKNFLYEFLKTKFKVKMSPGNVNTLMGLTKFINEEVDSNEEVLIFEIGIDEVNGMKKFRQLLSLDIGIITSIGSNHLVNFKTLDNVFKSKLQIKELLKDNGLLYLNNDDEYLSRIKSSHRVIKYSKKNIKEYELKETGIKIKLFSHDLKIKVFSPYLITYLDALIKIGLGFKMSKIEMIRGMSNLKMIKRRLQICKTKRGYLINDSYNANYLGIKNAVEVLDMFKGSKVIVTSGIIELGKDFVKQNQLVRDLFEGKNVIFVGEKNHPLLINHHFQSLYTLNSLNDAYTLIESLQFENVLLLSKGEDIFLR